MLFVVVSFIALVPTTLLQNYKDGNETLSNINASIVVGPLIILLLVAISKLNKTNICMQKSMNFTGTDYLLLFLSSAIFVYDILLIIALIGLLVFRSNIDTLWTIFRIFYWICSIVQVWGQTKLLMTAKYIIRSGQSIPRFLRLTLIYVMSINIGLWLCQSIDHKWVENDHIGRASELISMVGESHAKTIQLVSLPLCVIYFFHSAVVSYNILKTSFSNS